MEWDSFPTLELSVIDRFTMLLRHEKDLPQTHDWESLDSAEVAELVVEALRSPKLKRRKLLNGGLLDLIAADRVQRAYRIIEGSWVASPPMRSIPDVILAGGAAPKQVREMTQWRTELAEEDLLRVLTVLTMVPPDKVVRVSYRFQEKTFRVEWWGLFDKWYLRLARVPLGQYNIEPVQLPPELTSGG